MAQLLLRFRLASADSCGWHNTFVTFCSALLGTDICPWTSWAVMLRVMMVMGMVATPDWQASAETG